MNLKKIVELMFPKGYSCIICGEDIFDTKYYVCKDCIKNLKFLSGRLCLRCSEPLISGGLYCKRCKGRNYFYDRVISVFEYSGEVARAIQNFKYNNNKYYKDSFGTFMAEKLKSEMIYADMVIPIPLCEKRLKLRGYNQSLLLAEVISKVIDAKLKSDLVLRVKDTPTQTNLNVLERRQNLKDAFKVVRKKEIKDKCVLIVDNVFTTGATVNECSRALKEAGATCVYVVTLAHTIKKENNDIDE